MQVGFIAALEAEAQTFRRREGLLASGDGYRVTVSGPGREPAARAAHQLIIDGCDVIVSWGVAGGLSAKLASGDLVVATETLATTGDVLGSSDVPLAQLLDHPGLPDYSRGRVLTVAEPVTSAREKRHLGSHFTALAVDMESTGIARVARSADRHFVAVRAISDDVDSNLPLLTLEGIDRRGRMRVHRVIAGLSADPSQLPALWRVAKQFRRAIATLKRTATAITGPAG